MDQRMQKQLREGVVVKQIVGGRQFKGCAFRSKPEIIHFKVNLNFSFKPVLVIYYTLTCQRQ